MATEQAIPTRDELLKFIKQFAWKTSRQYAMGHLKGGEDTCRDIHFQTLSFLKKAGVT